MGDRLVRKGLVCGIIFLFIGINIQSTGMNVEQSTRTLFYSSNTLYVGGTGEGNYTNIQDAINDSVDGDTVFVYDDSSPYYENVIVDKSINLIGENKDTTVIDGSKIGDVVNVSAEWVNISGFTIRNGCDSGSNGHNAGIYTNKAKFTTITSNIITSNFDNGIHIYYSTDNTITDNIITSNFDNGIRFSYSNSNTITDNIINLNDDDGIDFSYSNNNTIKDNIITSNEVSGIDIHHSKYNTIADNDISRNIGSVVHTGYGIVIWYSLFNTITGNNIISNYQDGICAILDSNFNTITDNNITNSTYGILIAGNNNIIEGNNINLNNEAGIHLCGIGNTIEGNNINSNNKVGFYLFGDLYLPGFNSILKNNFIDNGRHAYFDTTFCNHWYKNYWKGVISPHVRINGMLNFYKYDYYGDIIWELHVPWINFDWYPAQKPYNITTTMGCDMV